MYTQCPKCENAFRVTALVLQQAGGRVRCGGCGHAFSALDHLSEAMPEPTGDHLSVPPADDFNAGAVADNVPENDGLAETSRRLLETLDELAGPADVRIEDTGVEWRVLDEVVSGGIDDNDNDSPTRPDSEEAESLRIGAKPEIVAMERRYDDNTPLGEDFDDNSGEYAVPPDSPRRRAEDFQDQDTSEFDEAQRDLALSEPDEWTGLLDEDSDEGEIPLEVEEELAAIHSQLSSREASSTPESPPELKPVELDQPIDLDTQFEMQAEAMGLDITGTHDISDEELTDEMPLLDEGLDELDDSGEFEDHAERDEEEEDSAEYAAVTEDTTEDEPAEIEVTGADAFDVDADAEEDYKGSPAESTGEFEANIDVAAQALATGDTEEYVDADPVAPDEPVEDDEQDDFANDDEFTDEPEADEISTNDAEQEDSVDAEELELSAEDEALIREIEADEESDEEAEAELAAEHEAPPQSEAEMTVNMEIDEELMAAAAEDEKSVAEAFGADVASKMFEENSAEVETIIMEGEFVRSAIDKEHLVAENEARNQIDEYGKLADTYALNRDNLRGGRRRYDPSSYTMIVGVVVLALVLIGQFMHGTRDSLATYGFFNQTMGPVYRMLGQPVTPDWNIKGWQFESTSGSTDDNEQVLTVFSRLVNKSETPLPFPLVHVSLTDRWEEIIGSRVLEPNEYLAGDLDPSKPVTPGENFTAVITIENPSEEATGFKLNVCYRVSPGRVRCAIEDFKN